MTSGQQLSHKFAASRVHLRNALFALAALFALTQTPAWGATADTPVGDWLVAKRYAIIRIVDCNGRLWGVVSWETHPSVDSKNPDPAKRTRPTLGMPVLLGMTMSETNEWSGEIYNSRDGHTYDANISLKSPDVLHVEGCVLGFLCGGEDWTRVNANNTAGAPGSSPSGGPTAADANKICATLLGTSGSAH